MPHGVHAMMVQLHHGSEAAHYAARWGVTKLDVVQSGCFTNILYAKAALHACTASSGAAST